MWLVALVGLLASIFVAVPLSSPAAAASSVSGVVNTYWPVTSVANADNTVLIGSASGAGTSLAVGDKVLLIQMLGTVAEGRGVYEQLEIANVDVPGEVVVSAGPLRTYDATKAVQLVHIPWDETGVDVAGQVTPLAWNGTVGGIVAMGGSTLTLSANVDASAAGYSSTAGSGSASDGTSSSGGFKVGGSGGGGGIFGGGGGGGGHNNPSFNTDNSLGGLGGTITTAGQGRVTDGRNGGAPGLPGDGGNTTLYPVSVNDVGGGGGGGGSYGAGGGGCGAHYSAAYGAGGGGGGSWIGGGLGGLGGTSLGSRLPSDGAGTAGNAASVAAIPLEGVVAGEHYFHSDDPRLFMGGSGGDSQVPGQGPGGSGGGIVVLDFASIVGNTNSILANGGNGGQPATGPSSGAGGGAGGQILIDAGSLASLDVRASGGNGGLNVIGATHTGSPGASGGGGGIWFSGAGADDTNTGANNGGHHGLSSLSVPGVTWAVMAGGPGSYSNVTVTIGSYVFTELEWIDVYNAGGAQSMANGTPLINEIAAASGAAGTPVTVAEIAAVFPELEQPDNPKNVGVGCLPGLGGPGFVRVSAPDSSLDIVKSPPTGVLELGETITYSFTVTNTGAIQIDSIAVTDPMIASVTCLVTTLLPAESTTCTGDYVVTQADADAGSIVNTAAVNGTDSGLFPVSATSNTVTSPVTQNPSVDIAKSVTAGTIALDETVTYTIVVTNTGDVTLSNIAVTDANLGGAVSCAATSVAPGASTNCTGTYVVTQADADAGEIINTASVDADAPNGDPVVDSVTVTTPVTQNPSIGIAKSVTSGTLAAGETVTYAIAVTNTGDVSVSNIAVDDPLLGGPVSCGATALAPAGETTCTGTYEVTQADVDAGEIVNTASVTADDVNGDPVASDVTETTGVDQTPAIDIDKQPPTGTLEVGQTITYPFVVTNTGNVTLTNVAVSDPLADPVVCDDTGLAPGATTNCSATYVITQADVDAGGITNTAAVAALDTNGGPVGDTDSVTQGIDQTPAIDIDKQPPAGALEVGQTIVYPIVVTNTGNVTLTNVAVSDPLAGSVTCGNTAIAPGASTNCTASHIVTQAEVDAGGITNTASVTADDPNGDPTTDSDSVTTPIAASPTMQVVKTVTAGLLQLGETITYTITVINTGNVTLSNVAVDDPLLGGPVACAATTLSPGASTTCVGTYVVTQIDVDNGEILNEATATADPPSGDPIDGLGTLTSDVPQSPAITTTKAITAGTLSLGETITYTITITNSGNVTMTNVAANDPLLGGNVPCASTILAPGASTTCVGTYVVTQADVDAGQIVNTAAGTGDDPAGNPHSDAASLTSAIAQNPDVMITKALTDGTAAEGETLTYTLTVTNTGDVTLTNVVADDPLLGGPVACAAATLAPGASTTCTGTYDVTQSDVDAGEILNSASVVADDPNGAPVTDSTALISPVDQNPAIRIAKSITAGLLEASETITYTIVATNTGDVTLTNVAVSDPLLGGAVECAETTLAPNAQTNCVGTYEVTQIDVDAGEILNTAGVSADDPNGDPVTGDVSLTTTVDQNPAIDLDKQPPSPEPEAGQTITYPFVVTNTGNVTLDDIVVSDPLTGPVTCPETKLAPGTSMNCSATLLVTQADVDAGQIENTATVTSTDPNNEPVIDTDTVTAGIDQTPAIDIDKQFPAGELTVGQTLMYTMIVTNTGNVTLSAVDVTDPKVGVVSCDATTLSPSAIATCTGTYSVTQADVDAGGITNTAGVTASDPNGDPVGDTDSVTSPIATSPIIEVTKTITDGTLAAGETITYTIMVTNTGNVTLSNVEVDDPLLGGNVACDVTTLAPGASTACVDTYVVTQSDVDAGAILNEATATAQPPSGDPIDGLAVLTSEIDRNPEIVLSKALTAGSLEVGEPVAYTIMATNTGDVTLSDLVVTDPLLGGVVSCSSTTLSPGASTSCVGTYVVTQADVDAGELTNFASVTSTSPDGTEPTGQASVTTPIPQDPSITIDKAITDGELVVGETLTYTLTLTNTGDVTLTGVTATDPLLGGLVGCDATTLAPGATTTCEDTYVVTQADVDAGEIINTASVASFDPNGDPVDDDVTLISEIPRNPSIDVAKALTDGELTLGGTLTYTVTVTNTGDVTLSDVGVDDPLLGGSLACLDTQLAPSAVTTCSGTYEVTQADVDAGEIINVAIATVTAPTGTMLTGPVTLTSDIAQNPGVEVAKSVTAGVLEVGEDLTYTIVVTNTGDVTLSDVVVDDQLLGGDVACLATTLAPLAETTCTGTYTVTQADVDAGGITNEAALTVTLPDGSELTDDVVEVTAIERLPAIDFDKQPPLGTLEAGESITYPFVVTNTGNVTLTEIIVTDPLVDPVTCDAAELAPGEAAACIATYLITQADVDAGGIVNTADVVATSPDGSTVDATDEVTTGLAQTPAIDIDKRAPAQVPAFGQTLAYEMTVTNTGNVTLSDIAVDDPLLGGAVECGADTLAPGESTECSGLYGVTQADVDSGLLTNIATVTATDTNDGPVTDDDTVEAPIPASPLFEVTKAITDGDLLVGETITYTITVWNTGNVTLTDVSVDDPLLGGDVPCLTTTLAPNFTTTCSGTYVVTQADVDAGEILNEAAASATAPSGDEIDGNATLASAISQTATLELTKAQLTGDLELGEPITYTITATNTGNVTLDELAVVDPLLGGVVTCSATELAPGESADCTGTYTVTQADIDAGRIDNVATSVAYAPDGTALDEVSNEVTTEIERVPDLRIDKELTGGELAVGETLFYSVTVTNTGNVTLTDIVVEDPMLADFDCPEFMLLPGVSALCAGSYVVTQGDVDTGFITNIATAAGVAPDGGVVSDDDEVVAELPQQPAVDLSKTRIAGDLTPGSTVTYALVVTNIGNLTLADVSVTDSLTEPPVCPGGVLAPGASMTCTAEYVVTQADMDAGEINNSAAVSTFAANGSTPTASADHTADIEQLPAVELDKQAPTGVRSVGETLTWTFEVTNTGNVTVTDLVVSDPIVDPVECIDSVLAPDASTTCTGTSVVTQADLDAGQIINAAQASVAGPNGQIATADDEVTTGLSQTPVLDIDKQPPTGDLTLGTTLTWTIVASNNGNVTLSDLAVIDPRLGGPVACDATTLVPAATATCTGTSVVTQADIDAGGITNTAVGQAVAPGGIVVTDDDTVDTPIAESPVADLVKALTDGRLEAGELVTYTITVRNTGNVTLTDVEVDDPLLGGNVACDTATLAPEAVAICTGTYEVTQSNVDAGLLTNTATMTGRSPSGTVVDAGSSATVEIDRIPAIDIDKMPPSGDLAAGNTIDYPIAVTNTGNVTLTELSVQDTIADAVNCPVTGLAPAETMTCTALYTVTQDDVDDGQITNTASVSGLSPDGMTVIGEDSITSGIGQTPSLDLDKAPPVGAIAVGETITYELTVTNTGNVTLTDVAVDDPMLGTVICLAVALEPGEATSCSGAYTVTQADVDAGRLDNTASASAIGPDGIGAEATDSVGVSIPTTTLLDVTKTATGVLAVGNAIDYTITATNNGSVTLSNLAVSDDLLGGLVTCDATSLAPGQIATCLGTHIVTQVDVDRGQLANRASGLATSPSGRLVSDAATAVSTIDQHPGLELTKQITDGDLAAGGTVTYTFVATNTGDVTISDVAITDPVVGDVTCETTTLEPGAATSCTAAYVVTQDDVDAGAIVNFATVDAVAPDGSGVTASTIETSAIEQTSGIDLDKQPPTGDTTLGGVLTYNFVVTNTGNVTLTDLQLDDPRLDAAAVCAAETLTPGASTTCVGTSEVTQGDIDAGSIANTATASAVDPAGDAQTSTDDVVISIGQEAGVDFDKAPPAGDFVAGETLTWTFTVTNTGNVSLSDIAVVDAEVDDAPVCEATELAPGEATTCAATSVVTQAQVDAGVISNTATVQTSAADGSTPTMSDTVDTPIPATPLIEASKEVVDGVVALGEKITWRILVTNTGNVTLTDLTVDDPMLGGGAVCATTRLGPGATTACTGSHVVTQADVDAGVITNQAAVSAAAPDGLVVDTAAVETVDIDQIASLELDKAPPTGNLVVGETIAWTLTATNTGNVTLTDLVVDDPMSGGQVPCASTTLAPGTSTDCVTTHVVTQGDVDNGQIVNTATATAFGPNGLAADGADSIVTPIAQGPAIDLNKQAPTGSFSAGETVTYTLIVTNTGDVTLDQVAVNDARIADVECEQSVLDPGVSTDCSGDMIVTQADIDSGEITNEASVAGSAPDGSTVTSTDEVTVPVAASPGIAINKAIVGGELTLGAELDWLLTATNTGNVTLTDVQLTDPMLTNNGLADGALCTFATLTPGEVLSCTGTSTVTQGDIDAGQIVNEAQVIATTPSGGISDGSVALTKTIDAATALSLDKQAPSGPVGVGDSVTYTFAVTNTGDTTLTGVTIDDANIADVTCEAVELAPGATTTCVGDYMLTADDMAAGGVTNFATVTATDPSGDTATAASTDTTGLPSIDVVDPIPCSGPISMVIDGGAQPYLLVIEATDEAAGPGAPPITLVDTTVDDGEYSQPLDPEVIDGGTYTIRYELTDANDLVVSGLYEDGLVQHLCEPEAVNDIEFGDLGDAVTVDVLANDSSTVVATTVRLVDPDSGAEVDELTVPGEGIWSVNSVTGNVTFTPEDGFEDDPTPVDYIAEDAFGEEVVGIVEVIYNDPEPTPAPEPVDPTPTPAPPAQLAFVEPTPVPAPTATPVPTPTPVPFGPPPQNLALTGTSSGALVAIGVVMILAGLAFVILRRRTEPLVES